MNNVITSDNAIKQTKTLIKLMFDFLKLDAHKTVLVGSTFKMKNPESSIYYEFTCLVADKDTNSLSLYLGKLTENSDSTNTYIYKADKVRKHRTCSFNSVQHNVFYNHLKDMYLNKNVPYFIKVDRNLHKTRWLGVLSYPNLSYQDYIYYCITIKFANYLRKFDFLRKSKYNRISSLSKDDFYKLCSSSKLYSICLEKEDFALEFSLHTFIVKIYKHKGELYISSKSDMMGADKPKDIIFPISKSYYVEVNKFISEIKLLLSYIVITDSQRLSILNDNAKRCLKVTDN